ncbi:NAD(P)-dependent oxidoreductase [Salana multivorans]
MLLALSLAHATAGFDLLERATAAVAGASVPGLLHASMQPDGVRGAVVLSTCNRLEVYLDVASEAADGAAQTLVGALAQRIDMSTESLWPSVGRFEAEAAAQHLFAVAAGLDSLVVGEDEIAGQVQRAFTAAHSAGASTAELDQLFQRAASTSRQVRRSAGWDGTQTSVVHLALKLVSTRVPELAQARVLLVGTGAHARTAVRALASRGIRDVTVYSTTGRAPEFAERHGLLAAPNGPGALRDAVTASDVVIACTSRTELGRAGWTSRPGPLRCSSSTWACRTSSTRPWAPCPECPCWTWPRSDGTRTCPGSAATWWRSRSSVTPWSGTRRTPTRVRR